MDGKDLVAAVRSAVAAHGECWGVLVPTPFVVNQSGEAAEEAAFQAMAEAKRRLRDHILETYGLSPEELSGLVVI